MFVQMTKTTFSKKCDVKIQRFKKNKTRLWRERDGKKGTVGNLKDKNYNREEKI